MSNIGIIAGSGDLPKKVITSVAATSKVFVASYHAEVNSSNNVRVRVFELGEVSALLDFFKENSVTKVCFAGGVPRPNFAKLKLDAKGREWIKKLGFSIFKGDDTLLKKLLSLIADEGFEIIDSKDLLADSSTDTYLAQTKNQPAPQQLDDINQARKVLDALSTFDIGQALIIEEGLILGIEAVEGTDNLINRCSILRKMDKPSGILIKCAKKGQSMKVDRPTVGLKTLENLMKNNFAGLAINQQECHILNPTDIQTYADKHGLFIYTFSN